MFGDLVYQQASKFPHHKHSQGWNEGSGGQNLQISDRWRCGTSEQMGKHNSWLGLSVLKLVLKICTAQRYSGW